MRPFILPQAAQPAGGCPYINNAKKVAGDSFAPIGEHTQDAGRDAMSFLCSPRLAAGSWLSASYLNLEVTDHQQVNLAVT